MANAVKVAVRVRPFNDRERKLNLDKLCVAMNGAKTTISSGAQDSKNFTFDHSFWSHDAFRAGADGIARPDPPTSNYATQELVYRAVGAPLLEKSLQGYNCSVFACKSPTTTTPTTTPTTTLVLSNH